MPITFVSTGKGLNGTCYNLMLDGTKIGSATAAVGTKRTGLHKARGTTYTAHLTSGDRWFYGSRNTVTREMLRAVGLPV